MPRHPRTLPSVSRRGVLVGFAGAVLARPAISAAPSLAGIRALAFDIYGTSVDYWGSIVTRGQAIGRRRGLEVDWSRLASDWPAYPPSLTAILRGERPWESFATLRREALREVVRRDGWNGLDDAALAEIDAIWTRLSPWPDVKPALERLRGSFTLTTLGNADMADMAALVKHAGLPFDLILTAELARSAKPDPKVYVLAPRYLALRPEQILMVACHKVDLRGARAAGLRAAFVARPLELGPNGRVDVAAEPDFDVNCASFGELADRLHA